ncbi:MAG: AmmeMemoRadiSam system protein B [Planctomycetales bacterium]|nr:AmmeMemoRadiSam system protein B [Planctomycetales bacterium]
MSKLPDFPRIRLLELVSAGERPEQRQPVLRDPQGYARSAALSEWGVAIVRLLNGQRSFQEIADLCGEEMGGSVSVEDVRRFIQQLDDSLFLDSERFAEHVRSVRREYANLKTRPAVHAGGAYAATAEALADQLSRHCLSDAGPGVLPWEGAGEERKSTNRLCAVMSPHIDLYRGGDTYAWAYDRVLDETDADTFVILGTAHTQLPSLFSVCRKDFATPLGRSQCDSDSVEKLLAVYARHAGPRAAAHFADDFPHRQEHSIELQTLWLQYALGDRRPYRIVPVLVGSFYPFISQGIRPDFNLEVVGFVDALRRLVTSNPRVCVIAAVDMAHIGPQFGDAEAVDEARLRQLWTADQHLLSLACAGDAEGWYDAIAENNDCNRICGLAPMYVMLSALEPLRGELLRYDQARSLDASCCVSFASAAFYRPEA